MESDETPLEIVVVGGGFAGLAAVKALGRTARRRASPRLRVTLVDHHNHHTFQPLLYQVATAGLPPQDIGVPLRGILRRRAVHVRLGEVVAVDTTGRQIRLADGGVVRYDRLVLAVGAVTADFGVPGVADLAFSLKSLTDAIELRDHLMRQFERASEGPTDDGTLTFVVAGGGPTGVELAGALAELVRFVIRKDFPHLDLRRVRIVLVEPQPRLLAGFSDRSATAAMHALQRREVLVRTGVGISEVAADAVRLTSGETLGTRTVIWAAGVTASPLAATLGVELTRGSRVVVDGSLRVIGIDDVYAVGDLAAGTDRDGGLLPQIATVAIQQGRYVARHIVASVDRARVAPFRYRHPGSMATIGRGSAVAELPGRIRLTGPVAWIAWLLLHLQRLVGFRNRASVLVSWVWNYTTRDHAARLILDRRDA